VQKFIAVITTFAVLTAVMPTRSAWAGSPAKSGVASAFAKVNIGAGGLLTFGGKGTTAAAVSSTDSNSYAEVTFTGKYPKDITSDKIVITATCESDNYGVANAYVSSVSATQLVIGVYGWKSDTLEYQGDRVFFSVFIGQ
jgi:hypothetical protein